MSYLKKHQKVRLVSLMIGANDFFVCQETTADQCAACPSRRGCSATLGKNVKTILSTIRNKAHYGGQIAIVNYYSLDYASQAGRPQIGLLNQAVDTAAKPFHVVVADGFGAARGGVRAFRRQHLHRRAATQLSTGGCGIHPSYAGQSLLAQALEKAIKLRAQRRGAIAAGR